MKAGYKSYYEDTKMPSHYLSREVAVGSVILGGEQPVRVQSMTNTNTLDTASTVAQCAALAEAGCELVRITAPTVKEAHNLANIHKELRSKGIHVPLVADIHFQPKAAVAAAEIVEKVRINPGNYADQKSNKAVYTDSEYENELHRIASRVEPLLKVCLRNGTAIRIGVNQGSLSERIMNRYGDTPAGMVESALEFVRICRDFNYHMLVLSMKSSNVRLMVQSTRLLVARMAMEEMDYPVHLGVTEAGDGEDGRIKSAIGIGTLLEEGIGDTIRVSLTEDPLNEIPFAKKLVSRYTLTDGKRQAGLAYIPGVAGPFSFSRRDSEAVGNFGGKQLPVVIYSGDGPAQSGNGSSYPGTESSHSGDDSFYAGTEPSREGLMPAKEVLHLASPDEAKVLIIEAGTPFHGTPPGPADPQSTTPQVAAGFRKKIAASDSQGERLPVILKRQYNTANLTDFLIAASIDFGSLLVDGCCDGIWPEATAETSATNETSTETSATNPSGQLIETAFGILQASGARITRTEFIACPSCGRTRFDIMGALHSVREATGHLKGLKIAVMGCIVNGPGEMADADYGYVGAGQGKVTLYKSKDAILKNVPEEEAVDALTGLIKKSGDWAEP